MRRLLLVTAVLLPFAAPALAASTCAQFGTINWGEYIVQQNEWNSSQPQCISSTGANLTVTTANFNMPNGAPADYPSVYKGCHWGSCTSNSGMPVQVSSATASSSVNITTNSSYNYDSSYDIWFNTTPTTSGQPNGTEMMIWVSHAGFPQPVGSKQATVTIDGSSWDVWVGNSGWIVISYVKTSPANSVSLDLKPFFQDAVSRGALQNSWYLIDIEYGFEIWTGGQGLAVNSFSATVGSGGGTNYTLSVSKSGSGSGTVSGSNINCGSTCSASYSSGTTVTLNASPASGSTFAGWSGACSGTGSCVVSMTTGRSVTATFNSSGGGTTYALNVSKSGSGSGTVTANTGGINCGSTCSASYSSGTTVTLNASPASGSTFGGWSGACTGTGSCVVSMTAGRSVTATFNGSGGGGGSCKAVSGGQSGNFNTTGAACFTVSGTINGWGCSNVDGRSVTVNGTATTCGKLPLPGSSPYTFSFTAGSYPWASFYWW